MKKLFSGLCALFLLCYVAPLSPLQAQTAAVVTKPSGPYGYDVSEEVVLNGAVSLVLAKPSQGMVTGSHLLLTTLSGPVDVSLGAFGLRGQGALSVAAGQQVNVTGVMKTLKGQQVFLARTVKVGERIYAIRNEHGIPVSPQARERVIKKTALNGDTL